MNTMRNFILATFLFFLGANIHAQDDVWSLEECIVYALENNISVKQSALEIEFAEVEKLDAIGNFLPSLNASASNSWNTGLTQNITTGILETQTTRNFSAGATAGLTIFDGLRNLKQYQRAKLSRLAAQYGLELMEDNIALAVANAYLQVLFAKENLKVISAQNELTQEQLLRTQELVDAGVLPSGDLLEIKATNANELQRIIVARNDIKIALISLAQLLRIEDYETFEVAEAAELDIAGEAILDKPVEELLESAKLNRFEIKVAAVNTEIAEKDVEIAKGAYWPTLGGFFNYNTRESGAITGIPGSPLPFFEQLYLNDGISFGFQMNLPILNGFATRTAVQRNLINVQRAELELEQAELDLESDVYQAYVDAKGAIKAYEAALVALEAQQQAHIYARERYEVGLTDAFDFSQAKLRLENAQIEALRAKYDYIFKLKVIELYFGIPVTELKL